MLKTFTNNYTYIYVTFVWRRENLKESVWQRKHDEKDQGRTRGRLVENIQDQKMLSNSFILLTWSE